MTGRPRPGRHRAARRYAAQVGDWLAALVGIVIAAPVALGILIAPAWRRRRRRGATMENDEERRYTIPTALRTDGVLIAPEGDTAVWPAGWVPLGVTGDGSQVYSRTIEHEANDPGAGEFVSDPADLRAQHGAARVDAGEVTPVAPDAPPPIADDLVSTGIDVGITCPRCGGMGLLVPEPTGVVHDITRAPYVFSPKDGGVYGHLVGWVSVNTDRKPMPGDQVLLRNGDGSSRYRVMGMNPCPAVDPPTMWMADVVFDPRTRDEVDG